MSPDQLLLLVCDGCQELADEVRSRSQVAELVEVRRRFANVARSRGWSSTKIGAAINRGRHTVAYYWRSSGPST